VPVREAIEQRFRVPAISVTGSEEWLGEWTFSLSMGSMTDEPVFWAHLLAKEGHAEVGALVEQSLVGRSYIENFRVACREEGIRIVAEAAIAQTAQDIGEAVRRLHDAKASAIVHCGFGFGIVYINPALEALGWDPPRFTGTAWQNAWLNPVMRNAFLGWTGLDQYEAAGLGHRRPLARRGAPACLVPGPGARGPPLAYRASRIATRPGGRKGSRSRPKA
jgi:branched-chain amino acid transport system substrate-binding protein